MCVHDKEINEVAVWGTERLIPEWLERAWMQSTGNIINPVKKAISIFLWVQAQDFALKGMEVLLATCAVSGVLIYGVVSVVVSNDWATPPFTMQDFFTWFLRVGIVFVLATGISYFRVTRKYEDSSSPGERETVLQFGSEVKALAALCRVHLHGDKPLVGKGLFNSSKVSILKLAEEGLRDSAQGDLGIYQQNHALAKRFLDEIKPFDHYRSKKKAVK